MPTTHPPFPSPLAVHWQHDPSVVYLNHGSFGGCPTAVLHAQQRCRNRMEAESIRFFVEDLWDLLDRARVVLAAFVHCSPTEIVQIPNATIAVATVLRHLADTGYLKSGDEIIAPDHEYPACLNNLRRICSLTGAKVVGVEIPFPLKRPQQVVDAVLSKVTSRTKAALISHVTSSSGLVLPLEQIVPELERRGIRTIVDGAHAVGMLPSVNLTTLGASYYTSNCHKWLCTPKGCAFLWVRPDLQEGFRPLALSNFAEKPRAGRAQFVTEFDYVGTQDFTAFMAIPEAVAFMGSLFPGGWTDVMKHNRELCLAGRDALCRALDVEAPAPDSMIGSICTLFLPAHEPGLQARVLSRPSRHHDAMQEALMQRHRIEVPLWSVPAPVRRTVRISAQVYNSIGQYEYLAGALAEELERERAV